MHGDSSLMRRMPVFPQVNSLPGSECGPPLCYGYGQIDCGQRRPNVRRHVVFAFNGMKEKRITVRREASEEALQIATHVGIGVLLDEERSGGMAQVQSQ